ncbi:hypothetical protein V8E53_000854 [Lactarius tabidus]
MPEPAPVSQYYSSGPGDLGPSSKSPTHDPSDDFSLLSNGSPNIPQLPHVDPDFAVPAKGVSDIETPSLNRNQRHPEGLGPASSHSQSRHPIDDVDPFPNEGSSTYTPPSPSLLRPNELHLPYFPQTPLTRSPEFDINTNTRCGIAPLQYDHTATPATPSRDISWMIHPNDFGDFSAATVAYGSMRDNRTSLGTRSIYSTSSRQTPRPGTFGRRANVVTTQPECGPLLQAKFQRRAEFPRNTGAKRVMLASPRSKGFKGTARTCTVRVNFVLIAETSNGR